MSMLGVLTFTISVVHVFFPQQIQTVILNLLTQWTELGPSYRRQDNHRTPIRSLELNCNTFKDLRESIYLDNISWYGPEHVATTMKDPRQVYKTLFILGNQIKILLISFWRMLILIESSQS